MRRVALTLARVAGLRTRLRNFIALRSVVSPSRLWAYGTSRLPASSRIQVREEACELLLRIGNETLSPRLKRWVYAPVL
jgi:hypothetical protein